MRNPIAVIQPLAAPSPRGHPLRFGKILSLHYTESMAVKAARQARMPGVTIRILVADAFVGDTVRFNHLREVL